MSRGRWLLLIAIWFATSRCGSTRALPVCYYTSSLAAAEREALVVELKDALPKVFRGLTVADAHDGSLLLARGPAATLAKLSAIWPDIGCVGDPRTPADVVKRDTCRQDMVKRVANAGGSETQEGILYLCRP